MADTAKEKQDAAVAAMVANRKRLTDASAAAAVAARKVADEKAKREAQQESPTKP
jgi:hypothetical protein